MSTLFLDLETRSQCDLTLRGLMNYATDPTTEVICMSYAFDNEPVQTWFAEDATFPKEVLDHISAGHIIYSHNAQFERNMFDFVLSHDYNFTPPKLTQWRCSAARATAHGLPRSLGNVCRALELPLRKQKEGTRLIRDYSAPGFLTEWKPGDKQLMQEYCEMDVMTMRQLCSVLRELFHWEWEQYHISEIMNDNGVPIDIPFAQAALDYSTEVKQDVDVRIRNHTKGEVANPRARKTRDAWVLSRLTARQEKSLYKKVKGERKFCFDQKHREKLLQHEDLSPEVRKLVELVDEAGGAAVSKYSSMINTNVDGRVYGAMIWNGAGATGRYSSSGLQLQNFKRDVYKDPEPMVQKILNHEQVESPSVVLGKLCRAAIYSPNGLTFSDYSQIEARVLPWLADEPEADAVLDAFRANRDIYIENAVGMFHTPYEKVDDQMRQAAKVAVLACGFGGGKGALQSMGSAYGMSLSDDEAKVIVNRWRTANNWALNLWYGLKDAAQNAVRYPNTEQTYKRVTFLFDGSDWLWMKLPSGRYLAYHKPRFEEVEYPWGDMGIELTCLWGGANPAVNEKWPRRVLNHLILSENATQAVAADIMRETIVRAHKAGMKILFSVHDELVVEGFCADQLTAIMQSPPSWSTGLPIKAETKEKYRYGK